MRMLYFPYCLFQVVCCMQSDNKEAFGLIYVGMSEVRDMEFSIDASKMIRSVSIKWENGIHLDEKEHMSVLYFIALI